MIFEPYPFGKMCGNLRTLWYLLNGFDRQKVTPVLVVPFESDFTRSLARLGVECIVLEPPARLNRYGGKCLNDSFISRLGIVKDLLDYNRCLIQLLKSKNIDVIYCNGIRSLLTVGWAGRVNRTPLLWYIKGELANPFLDRVGYFLANKILFFSESNRWDKYPRLSKWMDKKVDLLKIGLDLKDIDAADSVDKKAILEEIGSTEHHINVAYIGQLYPPKGVHFLIEALAQVVKDYPNIRLNIIGHHVIEEYADYRNRLEKLIRELNLTEYVIFVGWRDDALNVVAAMDIVVHPSLAEGFGRAVLEAMALGKPVVMTKVGGLRDTIDDGRNGYLVNPADVDAIALRISQLCIDEKFRIKLGQAARETVLNDHRIEDKLTEMSKIITSMSKYL